MLPLLVHGHQHLLGLGPIEWLLNELIGKIFGADPSSINNYDPNSANSGIFGFLLGAPSGTDAAANNPVFKIYNALAPIGLALAAVGLVTRLLKMLADQRTMGTQIVADLSIRALAAYLVIDGPGPNGVPFGAYAIGWFGTASTVVATAISGAIQGAVSGGTDFAKGSSTTLLLGAGKTLIGGLAGKISGILLLLVVIPELLLLFYVIVLWLARYILLLFAAGTAPLCWAVAVFDTKNRFVEWWVDCFTGAITIPLVILPGVALVLSLIGSGGIFTNPVISPVIAIGGLWMIGKSVHRLTWKHFSHGGPVGALTAGIGAAMFMPNLALDMQASAMAAGVNGGRGFLDNQGPIGKLFNRAAELGALKGGAPFTIGPMYSAQRHMRGIESAMGQGKNAADIPGSFFNRLDGDSKQVALAKFGGDANKFEQAVHDHLRGNLSELEWDRFDPRALIPGVLNSPSASGITGGTPLGGGNGSAPPSGPLPVGVPGGPSGGPSAPQTAVSTGTIATLNSQGLSDTPFRTGDAGGPGQQAPPGLVIVNGGENPDPFGSGRSAGEGDTAGSPLAGTTPFAPPPEGYDS